MANGYMPRADQLAKGWMTAFANGLVARGDVFHVTPSEAADVAAAVEAFAIALQTAFVVGTRTKVTVNGKDQARAFAENACRPIYARIKADPSVPDGAKIGIGVRPVNAARSRIGTPDTAPGLCVEGITTHSHELRYSNPVALRGAKPFGAVGVQIFRHLAATRIEGPVHADYVDTFTRPQITIPYTVADDLKIATYFARWINRRGQAGPWSNAVVQRVSSQSVGIGMGIAA